MLERLRIVVHGAVQGVGFRPFVFRLATELKLTGWVSNSTQGVLIEVEGLTDRLQEFRTRVEKDKPPNAVLQSLETSILDPLGYDRFEIRETEDRGTKTALILPDIATCRDCREEIFDADNRRFCYPFTNCTNCGPRFSIIEALPYDRAKTSMKKFVMCAECDREYHDPLDRRFHAQPNACPRCGPQLQLWAETGAVISDRDEALHRSVQAVRNGKILALKGIGGFQLIVDARNRAAVNRLRERKRREEKPFAVMFPSLAAVKEVCGVSELEHRLLLSPESPIVLVERDRESRRITRPDSPAVRLDQLADSIAPNNPNLGVMLPYTPLHHLFMDNLGFPVVATSGNLSDEPICINEREAVERLGEIADFFLVHDRPIIRHVDDSIVRVMCGREMVLRRARGFAPLPVPLKPEVHHSRSAVLAVGAHLKSTVALKIENNIFISQHIGDLETEQAFAAFRHSAGDLPRLYEVDIDTVACDLHPDYLSTRFASELPQPKVAVQHHWAHVVACMMENEIAAPALGVAWDGTGYGLDATIWGGEFLVAGNGGGFERAAHLRQFRLPGGDRAIQEPRRTALGVLHEIFGDGLWKRRELLRAFTDNELAILRTMLDRDVNAPRTSSAGRLFDAVSALIGLRDRAQFEGQAAMELEFIADDAVRAAYPFTLGQDDPMVIDWEPTMEALVSDSKEGVSRAEISAKFHNMLVEAIVAVARKIGEPKIVLTGGCFQNRFLLEHAVSRLRQENFRPYWHQRIPPNDGGIAVGQAVAASLER